MSSGARTVLVPEDFRPRGEGDGKAVHFMGVGGAGMSALAEIMLRSGVPVTGCDLRRDPSAQRLESFGGTVHEGHDPAHVEEARALVVSAAVPAGHPEILRARERGLPVIKRAAALGKWVRGGTVVGIAGTHGKTTTTAMATEILHAAGLGPTGFVGGTVPGWGSNLHFGGSDLFVVEADEYDRSFLELRPRVAVVTNLEADHLDIFGDLEGVRDAFRTFIDRTDPDGRVAVCADDPGASGLLPQAGARGYSYGLSAGAQLRAVDVRVTGSGSRFAVLEDGAPRGEIEIGAPGEHNVRNALGAAAAARFLGAGWDAVREGLDRFRGVARRYQVLGTEGGVRVVDDYAHHPTEIRTTLHAARRADPDRRLVAVFQPHLFTRTRDFSRDFGRALAAADVVWVTDVYPAREPPIPGITGKVVVTAAEDAGAPAVLYHPEVESLAEALVPELRAGDLCLLMGAGSIDRVGPELLRRLGRKGAGHV